MPCKFCGLGFYYRHGPRPLKVDSKHTDEVGGGTGTRNFRERTWPFDVALYQCSHCGHLQAFGWEAFRNRTGADEVG